MERQSASTGGCLFPAILIPAPLNLKGESQAKAGPSIGGLYLLLLTSFRLIFESPDPKMSRL